MNVAASPTKLSKNNPKDQSDVKLDVAKNTEEKQAELLDHPVETGTYLETPQLSPLVINSR